MIAGANVSIRYPSSTMDSDIVPQYIDLSRVCSSMTIRVSNRTQLLRSLDSFSVDYISLPPDIKIELTIPLGMEYQFLYNIFMRDHLFDIIFNNRNQMYLGCAVNQTNGDTENVTLEISCLKRMIGECLPSTVMEGVGAVEFVGI